MNDFPHHEALRQFVPVEIGEIIPRDVYTSMSRATLDIIRLRETLDNMRIDVVTQLPNRFTFDERFSRYFWRTKSNLEQGEQRTLGVMATDLDNLKLVNDHYRSHDRGDDYLRLVAQTIQASLRPQDQIYRVGGDEFIAILPDIKITEDENKQLEEIEQRARSAVNEALAYSDLPCDLGLGVSMGIDIVRPSDEQPLDVINRVDSLMYADKNKRRQE